MISGYQYLFLIFAVVFIYGMAISAFINQLQRLGQTSLNKSIPLSLFDEGILLFSIISLTVVLSQRSSKEKYRRVA